MTKFDDTSSGSDTTRECDGQTDKQKDKCHKHLLSVATRGGMLMAQLLVANLGICKVQCCHLWQVCGQDCANFQEFTVSQF